jgi:prepilin-type N-terminal cleavage/methylation domain-containing protein
MYAPQRQGFTLMELLIAMTIMLFIAGITMAFLWSTNWQYQNATRGAEQLQGWLLIAKQRALRDGAPRGVRLLGDPSNPQFVTQLQYIEQPNDYTQGFAEVKDPSTLPPPQTGTWATGSPILPGLGLIGPTAGYPFNPYINPPPPATPSDTTGFVINFYNADLTGGSPSATLPVPNANYSDWLVQPGDFFETPVPNDGPNVAALHLIIAVVPPSLVPPVLQANGVTSQVYVRQFGQQFPYPVPATAHYRIVRAPRPMAGEPNLQLPKDVAIDLGTPGAGSPPRSSIPEHPLNGYPFNPPVNSYYDHYDILFSPNGSLLAQGQRTGKFILWVRDNHFDGMQGDQTLICIYNQTGFIAAHPADPGPNNYMTYPPGTTPYTFTQSGTSSGL